jgi:hypothetical protein
MPRYSQWMNTQYSKLLNSIKDVDKSYESSTFNIFKDEIEECFNE